MFRVGVLRALVVALAATALVGSTPAASDSYEGYYPDLQTVVPHHVQLVNSHQREILRFSNGFVNLGGGPLALRPEFLPTVTRAIQEIRDPSGTVVAEHFAGEYEFHPQHNHWHIDNVALFEVRAGSPTGPVVGTNSIKVGFCLIDWYRLEGNSPTSQRTFFDCERGYQGSSVGWVDQYHHSVEGQQLDLTGVPSGNYYLVSTVNPHGVKLEQNYTNNTAWVSFHLSAGGKGNRQAHITGHSPCATPAMCGIGAPNR